MNDIYHYNYEEALKNPLDVKILVFNFGQSSVSFTTKLPDERIKNFIRLEKIYIQGYKDYNINLPSELKELKNLKVLSIESHLLQEISFCFDKLEYLNYLTLHCALLKSIPKSISTMRNLKKIDIYNSEVKSIDLDFTLLDNLEEFRWGQISFFPIPITNAKKLIKLNLDASSFETINSKELVFPNLKHLELKFSKLKEVPKCFETIETLQSLDFSYSTLNTIEFDFKKLTNLTFLYFGYCENFDLIDMNKFINSILSIKNLKHLETPPLSKKQKEIKKQYKFDFNWRIS